MLKIVNYKDIDVFKVNAIINQNINEIFDNEPPFIIPSFIQILMTDDRYREYWSIVVTNQKNNYLKQFINNRWETHTKKRVFSSLMTWALDKLLRFKMVYGDVLTSKQIHSVETMCSELANNKQYICSHIHDEFVCIFTNNKKKICETHPAARSTA
jgi:hypothetical protein